MRIQSVMFVEWFGLYCLVKTAVSGFSIQHTSPSILSQALAASALLTYQLRLTSPVLWVNEFTGI